MGKTLLTILLVLTSLLGFCQIEQDAKRVVANYCTLVDPPDQAKKQTQALMDAYFFTGEDGFDQYLDIMDDSWYSGVDVYLGENDFSLIELIESDEEAQFRLNGKAIVTVATDGLNYLVVIYSFP